MRSGPETATSRYRAPRSPGPAPPPRAGRQLRLALAMRGGVSLAVWMGGACAEIDRVRAAGSADDRFWRPLLDAAGFGSVRVDVLAGASAGGLNGTLLAATLMYGIPFGAYRDVWLEVADIRALLRDPSDPSPVSLLRGDEYFLTETRARLDSLVAQVARPYRPATDYLDLTLTATLFDPVGVPVLDNQPDPFQEASYRALFRFRHDDHTSDFFRGDESGDTVDGVIAKLALAARSTSSFPGAFEPATVHTRRPTHVGARARIDDPRDMFGLFSDASRPVQFVMDGGVLDNIPVAHAIDRIAAAKADGPTERWLVYLDPSPAAAPPSAPQTSTPDTLAAVLDASRARGTADSVLSDIEVLRSHNELVYRYRALRRSVLGPLARADGPDLGAAVEAAAADYAATRRTMEAHRARGLLEDPVRMLGEDPFSTAGQRWPLGHADTTWSSGERDRLESAIGDALAGVGDVDVDAPDPLSALGPEPLPRLVRTCLEGALALESRSIGGSATGPVKARLYDLDGASSLLRHLGDLYWPVHAAHRPPAHGRAESWARAAVTARARFLAHPDADPTDGAPDVREPFAVLRTELDRRLRPLGIDAASSGRSLPTALWALLAEALAELAAATGDDEDPRHHDDDALFRLLLADVRAAGDLPERRSRSARALVALEVLTHPLLSVAETPPAPIRLVRVAGSLPSPLAHYFPGGRLTVHDKLAGNDLMNFAAFYKRSWRANDWMWGRMDAAAGLVGLLLRPSAVAAQFAVPGVDADAQPEARAAAFAKMVEDVVRSPLQVDVAPADLDAWAAWFDRTWQDASADVRAEADALFAGADTDLSATKSVLTARRQWDLLVQEIPAVVQAAARDGLEDKFVPRNLPSPVTGPVRGPLAEQRLLRTLVADRTEAAAPVRSPDDLRSFLADYRIGQESVLGDAGSARFTTTAADAAVVAWKAFGRSLGGRAGWLAPIGFVLSVVRRLALATVRAPRPALLLLPILAMAGAWIAVEDVEGPFGIGPVAGAVVAVAATAVLLYWGRMRLSRLAVGAIALALAGWAAAAADVSLTLRWGDWATAVGVDGLWAAVVVFVVVALVGSRLLRTALARLRRARSGEDGPGHAR